MSNDHELLDLSEDDLTYYRDNPEAIRELLSRETVRRQMAGWIVAVAMLLVTTSKFVAYYFRDTLGDFFVDVVVDLIFEMGAALMGAVATLVFVEMAQASQFEENKRLYRAVKARLAADKERQQSLRSDIG